MKMTKYYIVSNLQILISAVLAAVLSASLIVINTAVNNYFELPVVSMTADGKCATVTNFKNGEAFTCNDVGMLLRNYRVKKQ
jgi:hypothetical protein